MILLFYFIHVLGIAALLAVDWQISLLLIDNKESVSCICTTATHASRVGIAQFVERRTRDRKAASSNPDRSGGGNFHLQSDLFALTPSRCPFHGVLPMLNA